MKKPFFLFLFFLCSLYTKPPIGPTCTINSPYKSFFLSLTDTGTEKNIQDSTDFLIAGFLKHSGQLYGAQKKYQSILKTSPYSYDGYLRFLSETNQFPEIVNLIDTTQNLFENDLDIQLIYVQSLLSTDKDKKAKTVLQKLKKKHPNNDKITYYSVAHSEKNNHLEKALTEIDTFIKNSNAIQPKYIFYFLKAKILNKLGHLYEAITAINKCLHRARKFDKGILLKAYLCEQVKQFAQAVDSYRNFIQINGHNPSISSHITKLLVAQNKFAEAANELKKTTMDHPNDPGHYSKIAFLEWKGKKFKSAVYYSKKALEKNNLFAKAKIILLESLFSLGNQKKVFELATKWIPKTPNDNLTIATMLSLCSRGLPVNTTINLLENSIKKHKKHYNILIAIADLATKTKQYDKTLSSCNQALTLTPHEDLRSKLRFYIGFTHYKKNNFVKAIDVLRKATTNKIVSPLTLFLLADLLLKSKKYSEALFYIDKASKKSVNAPQLMPFILDTKGLILYALNKHNQAIAQFERAHNMIPQDNVIRRHFYEARSKKLKI